MLRSDTLKQLYTDSLICDLLEIRKIDENEKFSSIRFKRNDFRLRAIEIWDHASGTFFRIYYAKEMPEEIKLFLATLPGMFQSAARQTDYRGDYLVIARGLHGLLNSDTARNAVLRNPVVSRRLGYEGLLLPDVDVSDPEIIGRTFSWKELLAIDQDDSEENELKKALSQSGAYLQRSVDGKSRYVGAAYSDSGFLARWLRHLKSNGDAKHLNFHVLENGYSDIIFTILEITASESAQAAESRWKMTLGTSNDGPYDGFRLNCN
jgi:hypothetical protein